MTDHTPTVAVSSIALTGAIDEYARAYPRGDFAALAKAILAHWLAVRAACIEAGEET